MATINIGNLAFTHKGDYDGSTAYVKNDVVYYSSTGSAYIAKQSTTGNLPTSTAHWNVFSAGSGGIWNAGLSLGSAGQSVKVNAAGNALEFGTISSEMVKLGSTSFTSGTPSEVNLDVTFDDSTYYKYELMGFITSDGTSSNMNVRLRSGGATMTAAQYDWTYVYGYRRFSNNTSDASYSSNEDQSYARIFDWNTYAEDYPLFFKIESMAEMQNTSRYKTFASECIGYRHGSGGDYMHGKHTGFFAYEGSTSAITGINLQKGSGNFKTGHLAWYGFKR